MDIMIKSVQRSIFHILIILNFQYSEKSTFYLESGTNRVPFVINDSQMALTWQHLFLECSGISNNGYSLREE